MKYYVTINDKRYEVEVEKGEAAIVGTTEVVSRVVESKTPVDTQTAVTASTPEKNEPPKQAEASTGGMAVKAPMAGGITDIKVSAGSTVKKGDTLLMLEAMKMENEITAPADGTVAEIKVAKGAFVAADDVLVVLR